MVILQKSLALLALGGFWVHTRMSDAEVERSLNERAFLIEKFCFLIGKV
jgi:hypothetical protein